MEPVTTELAYSYGPKDLFDARTSIALPSGKAIFEGGVVVFVLTAPQLVSHEEVKLLDDQIRTSLLTRQLLTGKPFSLVGPRITHHDDVGRRHHVMLVGTGRFTSTGFPLDVRIADSIGAIVQDTKAARIQEQTSIFRSIALKALTSPTLKKMLESYSRSIEDPENALIHLYEIRDAVSVYLGGKNAAVKRLKISPTDWNDLGRLANDEPIAEGRHRGRSKSIRSASKDEIASARTIGRHLIELFADIA